MIYHVFANRSNIGDWLSAKGIQNLLSPLPVTECLCDEPYIEETIGLLMNAKKDDLIIIGGGGLFMDYFTPFWQAFLQVARQVPFGIWGIGCCDLKQEASLPGLALMQEVIGLSQFCIVRDELTRTFLSLPNMAEPVPCPSINVFNDFEAKGSGLFHVNNYSTAGADTYDAMCEIAKKFTEEKGIIYRETNNRIKKDSETELALLLRHYQRSDIILSSALHGCVIGIALGKKVIAVSGDRKIEAFMQAIGLQYWVLNRDEVSLLKLRLSEVENQQYPIEAIEAIRNRNQAVAREVAELYHSLKGQIIEA
jgi:polysaccharide pyruvyl transferase WcaK-like protein